MIIIENLYYTYETRTEPTLKGIDLKIKKGDFVLITGPTGCGKSTLLKTLNGIIPHILRGEMQGRVLIEGKNTKAESIKELTQKVGLVFQNPEDQIFSTIVEDEVAFGPENLLIPKKELLERVINALKKVGMLEERKTGTNALSGGQKQRVAIASLLALQTSYLALDEPLSQLDPLGADEVLKVLKTLNLELGITIILVEHRIHEVAPLCNRVILMDSGKIIMDKEVRSAFKDLTLFKKFGLRVPESVEIFHRLGLNYIIPLNAESAIKLLKLNKKKVMSQLQKNPTFFKKTIPKFSSAILIVDGVYFTYSKKYILQDINLKIGSGEMVALIGNNGSGKTTLLLHFAAILKPTDGILYFKGKDTKKLDPYTLAGEVGVVFQNPDLMLFCDTVLEEVSFGPRNLNISESEVKNRVNSVLKAMNLQDLKYEPPLALSRGQRFRVAVAGILSMKPDLILLDEPTTGQDKVHIESLMQYLKKLTKTGITVVFITHDLETALKYADRLMVLNSGKIIADGTPREVFNNLKLLEKAKLKPPTSYLIGQEFGIEAFSLEELVEGFADCGLGIADWGLGIDDKG